MCLGVKFEQPTLGDRQIRQSEQRMQSRGVPGRATVPNLRKTELTLDDSKRMLNLRPNSGFDSLLRYSAAQRPFPG